MKKISIKYFTIRLESIFFSLVLILWIILFTGCMSYYSNAIPKQNFQQENVIQADPPEPSAMGYRILSGDYPAKKKLLIKNILFSLITHIDGDKWLIEVHRTPGWNSGKYGKNPKLAFLDMTSGELIYTPYEGRLRCYDGKRIAYYKEWPHQVMVGEYGEKMEPFTESFPNDLNGLTLDKHCQIIKRSDIVPPKQDEIMKIPGHLWSYRFENGAHFLVQRVMVEPTYPRTHMNGVPEPVVNKVTKDQWIWRGANGETKLIPTNQGEVFGVWNVLPFEEGSLLLRPQTSNILAPYWVYKHERILYPDGRLDVYPFPDLIWNAIISGQGQVSAGAYMYTKAGLIWSVQKNSIMPEGDYIEDKQNKTLTKVLEIGKDLGDGCRQLLQERHPKSFFSSEILSDYYILDFCNKDVY